MKLSKIKVENFRLLKNSEIDLDKELTVLIGKNNSAKTTLMNLLKNILNGKNISYDDYPLSERKILHENFYKLVNGSLDIAEFKKSLSLLKLTFFVDYSLVKDDEYLGGLSPFIIDLNEKTTEAIIQIESEFLYDDTEKIINDFREYKTDIESIKNILRTDFKKIFKLTIKAINPTNIEDFLYKDIKEIKELFPFYTISAERNLDENDDLSDSSSLKPLISKYFTDDMDNIDEQISKEIIELRKSVNNANIKLQNESTNHLSKIVNKSIGFGYPNSSELKLGIETSINVDEQISNNAILTYQDEMNEKLPNTHNGLGFKNLIKMQFQLAYIAKELKKISYSSIPLLFIEEPESHMHPQMQSNFVKYINKYIKNISDLNIQTLLTTHSPHIANSVEFSKIRYSKRSNNNVDFLNLGDFEKDPENKDNKEFLTKYLTITRCDMFFADKIILVEGSTERLLIPDIINKCHDKGYFKHDYDISNQYYTIIEVGGAYAHKFIPFLNFLGTPSLIITDIDACGESYEKTIVSTGKASTNATINYWYKEKKQGKINPTLKEIILQTKEDKTISNCHIEFQTIENEICARSLEGAIQNVNRDKYELQSMTNEQIEKEILNNISSKEKTEFIMNLIFENTDYIIPDYITKGLKWLSNINNPNQEDSDE